MGGIDVRRGTRWFCVVASVLAVTAGSAVADDPPTGDFTVTPDPPNQGERAVFRCEPCPSSTDVNVT
jgi:hypothetical protein